MAPPELQKAEPKTRGRLKNTPGRGRGLAQGREQASMSPSTSWRQKGSGGATPGLRVDVGWTSRLLGPH